MVYIILGKGFEEIEALAPCDILRRAGAEVRLVSLEGDTVCGGHSISVAADCNIDDVDLDAAEMIVIPGGMGGVESIEASDKALGVIRAAADRGSYIAAICAGPRVLAKLGILEGKSAVCFPGLEDQMTGGNMTQANCVVKDGKVITSRSAGTAIDFALSLVSVLYGEEAAEKMAQSIYYKRQI